MPAVQPKRKSKSAGDTEPESHTKKRKHDVSWLTEGLAGSEPLTALKRFIQEVEEYNTASDDSGTADVVYNFLTHGGTGKEFLDLLDQNTKRKAPEVASIFNSLEALFTRMSTDLSEYRSVGAKTASIILQSHMVQIYKIMAPSSNAVQVKSALRLLSSMVTLGHLTAREVIVRFDFTHACVAYVLQRRSLHDLPDIRSTYLMFLTALLVEDDSMLLRTMGENSAILQPVFPDLIYDSAGTLRLFLTALRDKLIASSLLSKTLKVHIFNARALQHLVGLFFWMGPHGAPGLNKDDASKGERAVEEGKDEEDRVAVAELVQSILLLLATSHKFGIAFVDYSLGLDGQRKNVQIFGLLETLGNFWEQQDLPPRIRELQSEIVVKALQNCPDLVRIYFNAIQVDLDEIRMSPAWLELCSIVCRILKAQNVSLVFNPYEKFTVRQQVGRTATLIVPLALKQFFFITGLTHDKLAIRLATGRILLAVMSKVTEFQDTLMKSPKAGGYNEAEKAAIMHNLKDLLQRSLPVASTVFKSYPEMSTFKDQEGHLSSWAVFLDILAHYSKLGFIKAEEQTNLPVWQVVYDAVICVRDSSADKEVLEPLQHSIFRFTSSLPDFSRLGGAERRALVGQLIGCLASTNNQELRQTAGSLLPKIIRAEKVRRVELDVWLSALERHPEAACVFANLCNDLKPADEETDATKECSPLLQAALNCCESTKSFVAAALCELVLCTQDPKSFASAVLAASPKDLMNPSVKAFLQFWTKSKSKQRYEPSDLGLSPPARLLFTLVSEKQDGEAVEEEWCKELAAIKEQKDKLGVILHQCMTCISIARTRGVNPLTILNLLRLVLSEDESGSLSLAFLQHPLALEWFEPMDSDDPFATAFSSMTRDWLDKVRDPALKHLYQRKTVDSIWQVVRGEMTIKNPGKLSVSEFMMDEIEPLITSMASEKFPFPDWLNLCLQRAARLRLESADQRLSWTVFSQVLDHFVSLNSCPVLTRGIYDVISVYPEFLDSVKELTAVLNTCLDSTEDCTALCNLLTTSSARLCAALGKWCIDNQEKHFRDVTWRLQTLPPYLSSVHDENKVLALLHKNLSPALVRLLINWAEYQETVSRFPKLPEFLHILITRCWTVEECREAAATLLSNYSKTDGLVCAQFADIGRRGAHHDLHVKLCLRAAVHQLKLQESCNPEELKALADEFTWLSQQPPRSDLAKILLEDSSWNKFLKYSLRTGLRALTVTESSLPPVALRLITSAWRLLSATGSPETTTPPSQQVFEMITSHSDFISVVMDEEGSFAEQKRILLELLTVLVEVNPKLCQGGQIPLLLASYHATRSATDKLILGLLRAYERNGVVLSPYKPYLWGPAAAAHYSIQRGAATRLSQQPEAGEVLALLDSEKLLKTAYNFPIRLRLNQQGELSNNQHESEDYDPRFILSLLAHILSPEYVVQCAKFTQSGATSLLFASLSSSCGEMRSLGWMALGRLFDQFQSASTWPERCLWLHLIECVRLGAVEQFHERHAHPPKLSNIITLFLAKAAAILRDPLHPMYRPVNNFLLVKPALDVTQVPEFFVLLHSTELPEHRAQQRTFLLHLLRDGLRSRVDYLVCARRRVFRILLTLQPSKLLVDESEKMMILEVVQSAVRNPIVAYDLILNRGLLTWLDGLLMTTEKTPVDAAVAIQLLRLVETLWNTLEAHLQRKRTLQEKRDEEEGVAELGKELNSLEAADDEADGGKNRGSSTDNQTKIPTANVHCRKPIWNLLSRQEQVIAPWIVCELIQLMISLWRALNEIEVDLAGFSTYAKVLRAIASHLHESKRVIKAAQDAKSLHFVSPCRTLPTLVLRQLVEVSSRFVDNLPDLADHLGAVEKSRTSKGDPEELTGRWLHRHDFMRSLLGQDVRNPAIRQDLHSILSLAECGV